MQIMTQENVTYPFISQRFLDNLYSKPHHRVKKTNSLLCDHTHWLTHPVTYSRYLFSNFPRSFRPWTIIYSNSVHLFALIS